MLDITIADELRANKSGIDIDNLRHMHARVNQAYRDGYLIFGTTSRDVISEFARLVGIEQQMNRQVGELTNL